MLYLALLSVCLFIGVVLQKIYKIKLFYSVKEELFFVITLLVIMIPMDIYAVHKGVWNFPGNGILGFRLFGLPVEEFLFVIVVPYFMLMIYKVVLKKIK